MTAALAILTGLTDEAACFEYLRAACWPDLMPCSKCASMVKYYRLPSRLGVYRCRQCGSDISLRPLTVFACTKMPLIKWFSALWIMANCHTSSRQLEKLGISDRTAQRVGNLLKSLISSNNGIVR